MSIIALDLTGKNVCATFDVGLELCISTLLTRVVARPVKADANDYSSFFNGRCQDEQVFLIYGKGGK